MKYSSVSITPTVSDFTYSSLSSNCGDQIWLELRLELFGPDKPLLITVSAHMRVNYNSISIIIVRFLLQPIGQYGDMHKES